MNHNKNQLSNLNGCIKVETPKSTDIRLSERVHKYIESNLAPFQAEDLRYFSLKKINMNDNQNRMCKTLLRFKLKNREAKSKQKTTLTDWRKLMEISHNITLQKGYPEKLGGGEQKEPEFSNISVNIPMKGDARSKIATQIGKRYRGKTNSKKSQRQQTDKYLESALMQNYYDIELNLTKRAQTAKINEYYHNSERPATINNSYRKFISQNKSENEDIQNHETYSRKVQTSYNNFRGNLTRDGQKQQNRSLFENSELQKASVQPFKIVDKFSSKTKKQTSKSRFLKDIAITKYERAEVKKKNVFRNHKIADFEQIQIYSNRQSIDTKIQSLPQKQFRETVGFLYSGNKI